MRSRLGLLVTATFFGCGTFVTETMLEPGYVSRGARSPSSVQVFASGPPARPHFDVSLLEVEQTHGLNAQGTDIIIRRLKERAAARGCDGIVVGGIRERSGAQPGSGFDLIDPGATTMYATCIAFIAPSDPPPAPTASATSPSPVSAVAPAPAPVPVEPDRGACRPP